jgi:hypothetical protein
MKGEEIRLCTIVDLVDHYTFNGNTHTLLIQFQFQKSICPFPQSEILLLGITTGQSDVVIGCCTLKNNTASDTQLTMSPTNHCHNISAGGLFIAVFFSYLILTKVLIHDISSSVGDCINGFH